MQWCWSPPYRLQKRKCMKTLPREKKILINYNFFIQLLEKRRLYYILDKQSDTCRILNHQNGGAFDIAESKRCNV